MKTYSAKKEEIKKEWYVINAEGQILGRLASKIAQLLRGKHKSEFTPHVDMGDYVIVVNAEKIRVSGNKEKQKEYFKHSGYPGGSKIFNLHYLRRNHPERIIQNAVKGMLPHNRLGRKIFKQLKVYAGPHHPHEAQNPQVMEL
ncbi:MAG: 50S ribosomal protein L13 [Fidelibacterota bacterium]